MWDVHNILRLSILTCLLWVTGPPRTKTQNSDVICTSLPNDATCDEISWIIPTRGRGRIGVRAGCEATSSLILYSSLSLNCVTEKEEGGLGEMYVLLVHILLSSDYCFIGKSSTLHRVPLHVLAHLRYVPGGPKSRANDPECTPTL